MDSFSKKSVAKVLVLGLSAVMVTACQKTVSPLDTFMPQQQQTVEKKELHKTHKKHHRHHHKGHKKHHHKHHHHKKHHAAKKEVKTSEQDQSMAPAQAQ